MTNVGPLLVGLVLGLLTTEIYGYSSIFAGQLIRLSSFILPIPERRKRRRLWRAQVEALRSDGRHLTALGYALGSIVAAIRIRANRLGSVYLTSYDDIRSAQRAVSRRSRSVAATDCTPPSDWLTNQNLWNSLILQGRNVRLGYQTRRLFSYDLDTISEQDKQFLATLLAVHKELGLKYGLAAPEHIQEPLSADMALYGARYVWDEFSPGQGTFYYGREITAERAVAFNHIWSDDQVDACQTAFEWLKDHQGYVDAQQVADARRALAEMTTASPGQRYHATIHRARRSLARLLDYY